MHFDSYEHVATQISMDPVKPIPQIIEVVILLSAVSKLGNLPMEIYFC